MDEKEHARLHEASPTAMRMTRIPIPTATGTPIAIPTPKRF